MANTLYDLLVDPSKDSKEEILRLAEFRGLHHYVIDSDIYAFLDKRFSKDSVENFSVLYDPGHWDVWKKCFAAHNMLLDPPIDPLKLEPFVARYILAINRIGIKTYYSCDGWHKQSDNQIVIRFKERYSRIWHTLMYEYYLKDNHHISWTYDNNVQMTLALPKTDKGKIKVYKDLNKIAEEFERLQESLFELKKKVVELCKGKKKSNLSDEQVEKMLREAMNKYDK